LQAHAQREKLLYDRVVKVTPDSLTLGRGMELLELDSGLSEGERDHRCVGEDLDERGVVCAEARRSPGPSHDESAEYPPFDA
jgi:hypothetical protein